MMMMMMHVASNFDVKVVSQQLSTPATNNNNNNDYWLAVLLEDITKTNLILYVLNSNSFKVRQASCPFERHRHLEAGRLAFMSCYDLKR